MNRIAFNAFAETLANRSFLGLRRVGRPHDFTPQGDGVLTLQYHDKNGSLGHELNQALEEALILMNVVKTLNFLSAQVEPLTRYHGQFLFCSHGDDRTDKVLAECIGLDDGQRLFLQSDSL